MKTYLLSLVVVGLMGGNALYAQEESEHRVAPKPAGPALSLSEILNEPTAANVAGYWHCTAYPEGHGHDRGYEYRDIHYNHAYWGAMQRCEQATHHHCHDVHCHYDHH